MSNVLVISNGHGEDIIASFIIKELLKLNIDIDIKVFPIVGLGKAYQDLPIEIVGPREKMPSGGFMKNSLRNFYLDIKGGLIGLTLSQIRFMKQISDDIDKVIVVGDIFILLLAGIFLKKTTVFLPTAKSEYIEGHYWVEKFIMKKYADVVLPRDQKTTDVLKESGVKVSYAGNAMMDCIEFYNVNLNEEEKDTVIGILPGSRQESYLNFIDILAIIKELNKKMNSFICLTAIADNFEIDKISDILMESEWKFSRTTESEKEKGIDYKLILNNSDCIVKIVYGHFGDVLKNSDIIIGLAGTANEQAVGMKTPVVSFPGKGLQYNLSFARDQKKLLGDSLALLEYNPSIIADKIIEIMNNKELYKTMTKIGEKRMGKSGATKKIALIIKDLLNREQN
ncbi:MAG: lipid-A-disaccharide synthase-related protein [Halanaerobiaceae bacterium]